MNLKLVAVIAGAAVLTALLLASTGCGGDNHEVKTTCTVHVVKTDQTKPDAIDAYVDASGSMRGYGSRSATSTFGGAISNAKIVGTSSYTVRWLNDQFTPITGMYHQAILDGKYTNKDSKFHEMLKTVINKSLTDTAGVTNGNVALLFTDGIISASPAETSSDPEFVKHNIDQLVNEISDALRGKGLACAIIPLASDYDGKYWDYQNKPVNGVSIAERPFYIIALGQPAQMRYYMGKLAEEGKIDLSKKMVFGLYPEMEEVGEKKYAFAFENTGSNNEKVASTYLPSALVQLANNGVVYQGAFDGEIDGKTVDVEVVGDWNKVKVSFSTDVTKGGILLKKTGNKLNVTLPLEAANYDSIIASLDTEDDMNIKTDPEQQTRTFFFSYLVKGIRNGITPNQPDAYKAEFTFDKGK